MAGMMEAWETDSKWSRPYLAQNSQNHAMNRIAMARLPMDATLGDPGYGNRSGSNLGAIAVHHLQPFCVLMVCLICASPVQAEDGPASDVPELAVLKHYLGNWNVEYNSEKAPFSDGKSSAAWTLDGRFLQQTSELNARFTRPQELRITRLMTYDQKGNVYRSWTFVSNGRTSEASGRWDADTNTMHWTSSSDDGVTHVRAETFGKDGVQSWTNDSMDAQNKAIGRSEGTSTRIDD